MQVGKKQTIQNKHAKKTPKKAKKNRNKMNNIRTNTKNTNPSIVTSRPPTSENENNIYVAEVWGAHVGVGGCTQAEYAVKVQFHFP